MFQLFIDYKFNFHFVIVSFQKYYHLLFIFQASLCFIFRFNSLVATVNCDNKGGIQINELECHSLLLPFNSDWQTVFGEHIFVLLPPN